MAAIENEIDRALAADADQAEAGGDAGVRDVLIACSSPGGFKRSPAGQLTPAAIIFDAITLGMPGAVVTWVTDGANITFVGNQAQLAAADMDVDKSIITATLTLDGVNYERSITIQTLQDGTLGATTYTWIRYADTAAGGGMSNDPTGKAYIGLAHNKPTAVEGNDPADYAWSLIKGTDGIGVKGNDGVTLYTWLKYSASADGTGMTDIPSDSTMYLGIAVNKTTAVEGTDKTEYTWSKFRGADGVSVPGSRGAGFYRTTGNAWDDATADAVTPGGNVVGDIVLISNGVVSYVKEWSGNSWFYPGQFFPGNIIVEGSIFGSALKAGTVEVYHPDGRPILTLGGLQPQFAAAGTKNSDLAPDIRAAASASSDLTLIGRGCTVTGTSATKYTTSAAWNADVYSTQKFGGGAFASAKTTSYCYVGFGLNNDGEADSNFASITFWFETTDDGYLLAWVNDEQIWQGTYSPGDELYISYDEVYVRWYRNGILVKDLASNLGTTPLGFDSTFFTPGATISNIRCGPFQSALWSKTGGPNRPQDNATVGAPSGTMVGGTEAGLVASRALAGEAAYNAQAGFNTALNAKLNAAGNQVLTGPIALQDGGALVSGTPDDGTVISATGFAFRQAGQTLLAATASGLLVKGDISGSTGTFGAVRIGSSLALQATAYNSDNGIWQGFVGDVPKLSIVHGSSKLLYDPSAAQPLQIINSAMTGAQLNPPTASPINNLSVSLTNGPTRSIGSRALTLSGGVPPYANFSWIDTSGENAIYIDNGDTQTATFRAGGNNEQKTAKIIGSATDSNGILVSRSFAIIATFGTPP